MSAIAAGQEEEERKANITRGELSDPSMPQEASSKPICVVAVVAVAVVVVSVVAVLDVSVKVVQPQGLSKADSHCMNFAKP